MRKYTKVKKISLALTLSFFSTSLLFASTKRPLADPSLQSMPPYDPTISEDITVLSLTDPLLEILSMDLECLNATEPSAEGSTKIRWSFSQNTKEIAAKAASSPRLSLKSTESLTGKKRGYWQKPRKTLRKAKSFEGFCLIEKPNFESFYLAETEVTPKEDAPQLKIALFVKSPNYIENCLNSFLKCRNKRNFHPVPFSGNYDYFYDEQLLSDINRMTYVIDGKIFNNSGNNKEKCDFFVRTLVRRMEKKSKSSLVAKTIQDIIRMSDQSLTADIVSLLMTAGQETMLVHPLSNPIFLIHTDSFNLCFKQVFSLSAASTPGKIVKYSYVEMNLNFNDRSSHLKVIDCENQRALKQLSQHFS